jgi:hypothetical protein
MMTLVTDENPNPKFLKVSDIIWKIRIIRMYHNKFLGIFSSSFVEIDGVAAGLRVLDNVEVVGGKAERFENHVAQLLQIFWKTKKVLKYFEICSVKETFNCYSLFC